jgi:hypothetical protein
MWKVKRTRTCDRRPFARAGADKLHCGHVDPPEDPLPPPEDVNEAWKRNW